MLIQRIKKSIRKTKIWYIMNRKNLEIIRSRVPFDKDKLSLLQETRRKADILKIKKPYSHVSVAIIHVEHVHPKIMVTQIQCVSGNFFLYTPLIEQITSPVYVKRYYMQHQHLINIF